MDPMASVLERVKGFGETVSRQFGFHDNPSRQNPIEILKRLQRETFSDLMKLRDRQDKIERIISSYKVSKGGPFQETSTHVRGEVDALGAILLMGNNDGETFNGLDRAGVRPGLLSRFTFETNLRESDKLIAELVAGYKGEGDHSDVLGSQAQLSLAKVFYKTEITDSFSAVAVPVGAHFRDIDAPIVSSYQGMSLTEVSELGPPLLNQHIGSAIGLTLRNSDIAASLAQSISNVEVEQGLNATNRCFRTFGQVTCQILHGVKLSLLGCHQVLTPSNNLHTPGAIAVPASVLRPRTAMDSTSEQPLALNLETSSVSNVSSGSFALKFDSLMDDCTRIGGWIEVENFKGKQAKWAISITDNPEDEVGWGISVGGDINGPSKHDQFQVESYLKFNIGQRFSLSPGLVYLTNGKTRTVGLMLQSHWSL